MANKALRSIATGKLGRSWIMAVVDPRRMLGVFKIGRYFSDWRKFNRLQGNRILSWSESQPCLTDWVANTPFDPHYFYQTHWASLRIAQHKSSFHVDIGSSTLFVSGVSGFVPVVFVDYRPLQSPLPGFQPVGGNITSLPFANASIPSLSCLHVIEHIGLGRYGDPLDPTGSIRAASELIRVLQPNGRLLLSTPVGRERIQFNAHRIFAPSTVLNMFSGLRVTDFALVDDHHIFYPLATFDQAARCDYGCGMFEFAKRDV